MHGGTEFLNISAILLAGAFLAVALCSRFRIPSIVGFLVTGIVLGPHGLHFVEGGGTLDVIGELGVVLLLFMLGLEFSFGKLVELRRLIFGAGLLQVVVTSGLVAAGLSIFLSVAPVAALLMGGAVALSSTALCLKTLTNADALGSQQGRIAIAVLLFQDLAALIFLVLHDAGTAGGTLAAGITTFVVGALGLSVALLVARRVLQPISAWVTGQSGAELSQLLAFTVALTVATGAAHLGLSPAIGAFAAGMMIGEGDARHIVEKEIKPFRDLFLGIFFIGLGTQLEISGVIGQPLAVFLWLLVLIPLKALLVFATVRAAGNPAGLARQASSILCHGGEFSLMLLSVALASGTISNALGGPLLLAIGLSLLAAPFLVRRGLQEAGGR